MSAPSSTVAVTPREAHHQTIDAITSVFACTDPPVHVVAVDGGSPRSTRRTLERLAAEHDFTLVRSDAVLTANEARNLAMRHVATEYVAFVDNDTIVSPGWLARLEICAQETGATLVSPIVLWGRRPPWSVHFAGGAARIVEEGPTRRYEEQNAHLDRRGDDLAPLSRVPTENVESHCLLARVDALRRFEPFDEQLLTAREHTDLVLQVAAAGGTAWLEPSAVVRYEWPKRLRLTDYPFFLTRWSDAWAEPSFARFKERWRLTDTSVDDVFRRGHLIRRLRVGPRPPASQPLRLNVWRVRHRLRLFDRVMTPLAVRRTTYRRAHCAPPRVVHAASWDREAAVAEGAPR